jgi:hypothetical protein
LQIGYLYQDAWAFNRWMEHRLVVKGKADDIPFNGCMDFQAGGRPVCDLLDLRHLFALHLMPLVTTLQTQGFSRSRVTPAVMVGVMQVHPYTLSVLPSNIVNTLSAPITVRCVWQRTTRYGHDFLGAASKLEACCRASAGKLQILVTPEATPDAKGLPGLTAFVSRGVYRLEVMWLTQRVQTAAHLQALGRTVAQYITHLTFITETSITDEVWSGLWAAFPHLEHLSLHTSSFQGSSAFVRFCAAAPNALELHMHVETGSTAGSQWEADVRSTGVLIRIHGPRSSR